MRLVNIHYVKEGSVLAKPIVGPLGNILLQAGVTLTASYIKRLLNLGFDLLFVEDIRFDDVEISETISNRTRHEAYVTLQKITRQVSEGQSTTDLNSVKLVIENMINDLLCSNDILQNLTEIKGHDDYTFHHSVNTTIIALILGLRMNIPESRLLELGMGVLMHDIGKVNVPEEILNKKGRLTAEEFEQIKEHTTFGYQMLKTNKDISLTSAHVALQHQEKWDGSGYPRGLKGLEIHEYGRIAAIADVYEALTSKRVYRDALQPYEAYEYVIANSGSHFEPKLTELFSKSIAVYPTGTGILLSNGLRGNVIKQNSVFPNRPWVRILHNGEYELNEPIDIDLVENPSLMIVAIENK